jgi:hypothetical protein
MHKCDICGRFISLNDFAKGKASRKMVSFDSHYSYEDYETLCATHSRIKRQSQKRILTNHLLGVKIIT